MISIYLGTLWNKQYGNLLPKSPLRPHHEPGGSASETPTPTPLTGLLCSQPSASLVAPRPRPPCPLAARTVMAAPACQPASHMPSPHCQRFVCSLLLISARLTPGAAVPGWHSLSGWTCVSLLLPAPSESSHVPFLCSVSPVFLCTRKSYSSQYTQASDPLGSFCFKGALCPRLAEN